MSKNAKSGEPSILLKNGKEGIEARPTLYRAEKFPEELRRRLRDLLVQGFSVPSAARFINGDPDWEANVTEAAVQQFAQSDKRLPADRAAWVTEMAEAISAELGGGDHCEERTGEERFINAVVMTGLLHLHTGDDALTVNQALTQRRLRDKIVLENRTLNQRLRETTERTRLLRQHTKLLRTRDKFIQAQTVELRQALHKFEKKRNVTPDTIREIREVYGLIADNVAQLNAPTVMVEARPVENGEEDDPNIQRVDLAGVVDPMAEIQRQLMERARLLIAAPEEVVEKELSAASEPVASGEWQVANEDQSQTSVVRSPSSAASETQAGGDVPDEGAE